MMHDGALACHVHAEHFDFCITLHTPNIGIRSTKFGRMTKYNHAEKFRGFYPTITQCMFSWPRWM